MKKGFWAQIKKPILALAPMAGVSDTVFRQIVAKYGKPDVFFTEFVSCDGLCSPGKENLLKTLWYTEIERPIVGQIFGSNPTNFYKTARLLVKLGFDGIDINTGCPDRCVEKQGAGAALIKNPTLAKCIVRETIRGSGNLPVSVKTRLGYDKNIVEEWITHLLEVKPVAITIHARTRNEMSKVPANWDAVARAVQIRNQLGSDTLILGNGDITSTNEARSVTAKTGVDGVMIGRGIYGNPWLFNKFENISRGSWDKRLKIVSEHAKLFDSIYKGKKNFAVMRKFFSSYVSGCPSGKTLKMKLMDTRNSEEVVSVIDDYLKRL